MAVALIPVAKKGAAIALTVFGPIVADWAIKYCIEKLTPEQKKTGADLSETMTPEERTKGREFYEALKSKLPQFTSECVSAALEGTAPKVGRH